MDYRVATPADLAALNTLERQLFEGDRISPRQMKRFIGSSHSYVFVATEAQQVAGYAILLFHRGTQLARLYSIAVAPEFRGRQVAQRLIAMSEQAALDEGYITLRLEVRDDNIGAKNLYAKLGYKPLKTLVHYYDDLADGIRMQKRLDPPQPSITLPLPLYVQTTPFTCGAACLLMGFASFDRDCDISRTQELQLWREATTIYMAAGHGGCSGHGLALAAHRRGYRVELWTRSSNTPFVDSVRDPNKKAVIELVHRDFCRQLATAGVLVESSAPSLAQLERWISQGCAVLLLISTYRFNGCKEPHWIILSGMNEHFFFFHDPHVEDREDAISSAFVPVSKASLNQIVGFGKQKQIACVVIHPHAGGSQRAGYA